MNKAKILAALLCVAVSMTCVGCGKPHHTVNGQSEHSVFYDLNGRIIQRTEFNRLSKLTIVYNYVYTTKSKHDSTPIISAIEIVTIDYNGNIIDDYTQDVYIRWEE